MKHILTLNYETGARQTFSLDEPTNSIHIITEVAGLAEEAWIGKEELSEFIGLLLHLQSKLNKL